MTQTPLRDIDRIVWHDDQHSMLENWEQNKQFTCMLCEEGVVTEWAKEEGPWLCMPYQFAIAGLEVQFLPIWNYFCIGQLTFSPVPNHADFMNIILSVSRLKQLGLRLEELGPIVS